MPPGVPRSYRALAGHGNVPRATLHHWARGRRSMEEKAQSQQYLEPYKEDHAINILLFNQECIHSCYNNFYMFIFLQNLFY
jgi:hypothetical protein